MNKIRLIMAILTTKNFIVITDKISDGYVEPLAAEEYLGLCIPIAEHLKQLARETTMARSGK